MGKKEEHNIIIHSRAACHHGSSLVQLLRIGDIFLREISRCLGRLGPCRDHGGWLHMGHYVLQREQNDGDILS